MRPWKRLLSVSLAALLLAGGVRAGAAFASPPAAWAAEQVEHLERAGLLENLSLYWTEPGAVIRRGDFCQLLVNLVRREGLPGRLEASPPVDAGYFSDLSSTVSPDQPGGRSGMYYAAAYGLTEGVLRDGRRLADCDGRLTREQAAKMMCALTDALERYAGVEPAAAGTPRTFADAASISGWAAESVARASALGLLQGDQAGRFQPQGTLTWEEACVMAERALRAAEAAAVQRDRALGIGTLETALEEYADRSLRTSAGLYLLERDGRQSVLQIRGRNAAEGGVWLETYDAAGHSAGVRQIPTELDSCEGFYESGDAYYLAFGRENLEENDAKEVYRVVRYDKDWNRLGAASITGGQSYTTIPYDFTSHTAMAEEDGVLVLHTARQRYQTSDGLRHQSNFTAKIRVSDMSVLETSGQFPDNHVSHSFAQYVRFDNGLPVYADHGDAYPRGFVLNVESAGGGAAAQNLFRFSGAIGDNTTNALPGGLGISDSHYLFAGASSPQQGNDSLKYCNAFLAVAPKAGYPGAAADVRWLTSLPQTKEEYVAAVELVQLNNNTFVVLWQTERLKAGAAFPTPGDFRYAVFDGAGNQLGETRTVEGFLAPGAPPRVSGNRISWVRAEWNRADGYSALLTRTLKTYELSIDLNRETAGRPAQTERPNQTEQPNPSGRPAQTERPSQPDQSGQSGQPGQTTQSGQTGSGGGESGSGSGSSGRYTETPYSGRTGHFRQEWGDGCYLDLEVVGADTIRFSGCVSADEGLYNYVLLDLPGAGAETEACVPFASGVPFSLTAQVDLEVFRKRPDGTFYVGACVCQNYTPGDDSYGGFGFQNGVRVSVVPEGDGCALQITRR